MDVQIMEKLLPERYHRKFLEHETRSDGRGFLEPRALQVTQNHFAHCDGSALIRCAGQGVYFAGIKLDIVHVTALNRDEDRAKGVNEGLAVSVDFPKISGAKSEEGATGDDGLHQNLPHQISECLSGILNSEDVFDKEQLVVDKDKEFFWSITINVMCLQYDGCAMDMCMKAAVTALQDTVLPAVYWDEKVSWWRRKAITDYDMQVATPRDGTAEDCRIQPEIADQIGSTFIAKEFVASGILALDTKVLSKENIAARGATKLSLKRTPRTCTFAKILDNWWIIDPTAAEESVSRAVTLCAIEIEESSECWHVLYVGYIPEFDFESLRQLCDWAAVFNKNV
eukprot:Lankesteria_metandrocarpae@DN4326_c0_g1_i1.p1